MKVYRTSLFGIAAALEAAAEFQEQEGQIETAQLLYLAATNTQDADRMLLERGLEMDLEFKKLSRAEFEEEMKRDEHLRREMPTQSTTQRLRPVPKGGGAEAKGRTPRARRQH